jgi:ADP-ribosylglycohydrolase
MTANWVALIDWDQSHVDVPDLDLVLSHNAAGFDDRAHDIAAQASAAWEPQSAGTTSTQSSGLPKFERSEQRRRIERTHRSAISAEYELDLNRVTVCEGFPCALALTVVLLRCSDFSGVDGTLDSPSPSRKRRS